MQESPYLDDKGFLLDKLQKLPFLGTVDKKTIKHILRLSKLRKFEDEEAITLENTSDSWIYLLFSGAIKVSIKGREIARYYEAGCTFGEVAALDGKMRSATVEAIGTTVCLAIDTSFMRDASEPFEQALFASILYKLFFEVLAGRLRKKDDELEQALLGLEKAHKDIEKFKVDRQRLKKAESELAAVSHELDALKKTVAKRWLIVSDEN